MRPRLSFSLSFVLFAAPLAVNAVASRPSMRPTPSEEVEASCGGQHGAARQLSGVVRDSSGGGIAHATVTLTCGDGRAQTTADAAGAYSLSVPAGDYQITVEAPNFGTAEQSVTVSNSSSGTVLNPVLQVGNVKSAVTVRATEGNEFATPVSSSGTKTDLPLSEVPQAISVVNRSLMDSQNVVKLDDALKNVPGVIAGGYYDGWDYYRIRGFDASFNTYIDGLRGGNGMMEETWGLESVEVLKGPSSALYGQSVLGGLVNITTRKPVPDFFVHAQVTAGSFNFVDPAVDIGGSLNSSRTVYGRLAALYHSANTFVDYTYRHRYYFAPSLTWKPRPSTWLTLTGRFQRDNGRQGMPLPAIGTVLPNPGNGILPISTYIGELEANANKMSQANQQFGVQFHHAFNDNLIFRENARFAWYQQNWSRIYYPAFLGPDNRTLYRYPYSYYGPWQTHETDTNIEGRARFLGMDHSALLGLDFYRSPSVGKGYSIDFSDPTQYEPLDLYKPVYGQNPVQSLIPASDTKTVTQYTGVYLQDHIRLPKHVTITGGGRFDWAKNESLGSANQNGHGTTPRLGVTWQAFGQTTVYASFSKSYLPQSGQVYIDATHASYLPPERGQQWEGGVKSSFLNGKLLATAALFQLDRKNVATANQAVPNFYLVTGAQRSRGVELEATLHPLAGWNIVSSYSFINAIVTNDTTLPAGTPTLNAPRNLFNIWSTYEIPRGAVRGLTFGFGGRHYTDQSGDLANSFRLPAYGIVDASASYRRGHAMWQVNANNVTNKRWYAGSYNDLYVKPGDPRVLRGTMSWNF